MRAIVRSARADEDLIRIWTYIAVHDPTAADRTVDAIARLWPRLTRFPLSGISRNDLSPGLRQVTSGNYLPSIVYPTRRSRSFVFFMVGVASTATLFEGTKPTDFANTSFFRARPRAGKHGDLADIISVGGSHKRRR